MPTASARRLRPALLRLVLFLSFLLCAPACLAQEELFDDGESFLPQPAAQVRLLYFASSRGALFPCPT